MAKKTYTLLVTSNRKSKTKSVTVPASVLRILLGLGTFIVVMVVAVSVDYVSLLLQSGENKRLKVENTSLRKQFQVVESKVHALENSLDRVNRFSTKIKLITDVDSENRAMNLYLGSDSNSVRQLQENELQEKYGDQVSGVGAEDEESTFFGEQPTNEKKGEIYRFELKNYSSLSIRLDQSLKSTKLQEQGLLDLYQKLSDNKSVLNSTPTLKPTKGWYSARFGFRMDPFSGKPVMHNGIDIASKEGAPIHAPADGVVSHVGYENNLGKVLTIDHGHGLKTRYAHNSQIFVELGQKIARKDVIAAVGNTGRSQGPHLYYEVRLHGVPVDPMNYIAE